MKLFIMLNESTVFRLIGGTRRVGKYVTVSDDHITPTRLMYGAETVYDINTESQTFTVLKDRELCHGVVHPVTDEILLMVMKAERWK